MKLCALGMRNAILGNDLNCLCASENQASSNVFVSEKMRCAIFKGLEYKKLAGIVLDFHSFGDAS